MTSSELEAYLHHHIPVSAAMGITVVDASLARVTLRAALGPNLNHRSTAFGGSVASLAVLAGWSLLRVNLDDIRPIPQIVVQRTTMDYATPIVAAFDATCLRPGNDRWERFLAALSRRRRGRLDVDVEVTSNGETAARLHGRFVAMTAPPVE